MQARYRGASLPTTCSASCRTLTLTLNLTRTRTLTLTPRAPAGARRGVAPAAAGADGADLAIPPVYPSRISPISRYISRISLPHLAHIFPAGADGADLAISPPYLPRTSPHVQVQMEQISLYLPYLPPTSRLYLACRCRWSRSRCAPRRSRTRAPSSSCASSRRRYREM